MTLALRDLQAAFASHLFAGESAALLETVVGDRIPAAARLRVHRHHVAASLAKVLGSTFPTVKQLVGDDFFGRMARAFVREQLPAGPVLAEYGAAFAGFVEAHVPAQGLPYLGDVARLDWALNVAFHSPLEARLGAADLAAFPAEQLPSQSLQLSLGTSLLCSAYPLDRIWAACRAGPAAEEVDLATGGVCLLVFRQGEDSGFVRLGQDEGQDKGKGDGKGEAAFLAALARGQSLERATEAAFAAETAFDLPATFPRLLALGVFAAPQ